MNFLDALFEIVIAGAQELWELILSLFDNDDFPGGAAT